jgi:hypothetical protein
MAKTDESLEHACEMWRLKFPAVNSCDSSRISAHITTHAGALHDEENWGRM